MKTIFISIFSGIEVKNLLRTTVARSLLADEAVRLVLLATGGAERAAHFRREFSHPRIIVESVPAYRPCGADALFQTLSFYALNTATTRWRAGLVARSTGRFFHYPFALALHWLLGNSWTIRLLRFCDCLFVRRHLYTELFERYAPRAIVCANLFDAMEVHLLREARARGAATVGYINSWDRVTARSVLRDVPDQFIVFNNFLRDELVRYQAVPHKLISVCGIPQCDSFFRPAALAETAATYGVALRPLRPRAEFLQSIGFSENARFIFYAPMGPSFSESDWDIIDLLLRLERENRLGGARLFVRFPPNDAVNEAELRKRPALHSYLPGVRLSAVRGADWDMPFEDLLRLQETLLYASAVVNYTSSIAIDASIFDKPVVGIHFETHVAADSRRMPTGYYHMEHYRRVISTGAIVLAYSPKELESLIFHLLENPSLQREERARLVRAQCPFADGRSGERIAGVILRVANGL